jgi:hypothetical protein
MEKIENNLNITNNDVLKIHNEIKGLIKDINLIKNELGSIKKFKENTVLNFKDIGEEFLKNEEKNKIIQTEMISQVKEFDNKLLNYENVFSLQNEGFKGLKNDIYKQIYDINLNINNKFEKFNNEIKNKNEDCNRIIYEFERNLMVKFSQIFFLL